MSENEKIDLKGLDLYLEKENTASVVLKSVLKTPGCLSDIVSDSSIEEGKVQKHLKKFVTLGVIDKILIDSKISYEDSKIAEYKISDCAKVHEDSIYNMKYF